MNLFRQFDFSGGLDAEFSRLKSPENTYPLLINGRARDGEIQPVRKHAQDTTLPGGNYQLLAVVGDFLLLIISGQLYYKNLETDSVWNKLHGFTGLDADVDEVYGALVPVTTNVLNREGTPDEVTSEYNIQIAPTRQCFFLSDGINQPFAIFQDLTWKQLNTFAQWSQDDPEYVPHGIIPVVSGNKLWLVSPDRKRLLQSVTGRFLDFVVNITSDGDKGGDADTQALAVDFNDITAVLPLPVGGLLITTLYAMYLAAPDGRFVFGEPVLKPGEPVASGAVNHKSFVDVVGDTAYISQSGIQSINVVRQLNNESNNFPLSAKISRYITAAQTQTAAVKFDDYALFAMNTVVGRGVFVFDTVRRAFVSLDTGFGTVKNFAVYKKAGINRLFFINTDNELHEAYASDDFQVCRMLLGDFSMQDSSQAHKLDTIYATFNNVSASQNVRLSYFSDNRFVTSAVHTITGGHLLPPPPGFLPFVPAQDIPQLRWGVPGKQGHKSSVFLEWQGDARLVGVTMSGSVSQTIQQGVTTSMESVSYSLAVLGELDLDTRVANSSTPTGAELTAGYHYYIKGTAHLGDRVVTDDLFIAPSVSFTYVGQIYRAKTAYTIFDSIRAYGITNLLSVGNLTDGTEDGYQRLLALRPPLVPFGVSGDDEGLAWRQRNERYGTFVHGPIHIFFYSTADDEIDGVAEGSVQANWLKYQLSQSTAPYKVVILHDPPYTGGPTSPGYLPVRLPFRQWGACLVIGGHTAAYERFYEGGLHYINAGTGEPTSDTLLPSSAVKIIVDTPGHVRLIANDFSLSAEFVDINNNVLDATSILPS